MPTVGKGPSVWGTAGDQQPKREMPVQGEAPFICLPSVLLLVTASWLFFLRSFSGEHLQIASVNAVQEWTDLWICTQTLLLHLFVWLLLGLSPCLPHAASASFFLSLCRSALPWILLTPLCVPVSKPPIPLPRCYGIAVGFLQEYTNRNRAGHCSRCGWAGIMAVLWKTAAVDAVVL